MRKQDGSAETGHEPCHVVVVDKVDGEAAELDTRTDEAKQLVASVRDCEDTELPAHLVFNLKKKKKPTIAISVRPFCAKLFCQPSTWPNGRRSSAAATNECDPVRTTRWQSVFNFVVILYLIFLNITNAQERWVIKGVGSLHESQDASPAPREGYRERQLLIVDEEMEDQNDLLELVDEMSR
ncbi:hypothetical protein GX48_02780 [Paracoccidioides brasiliensis]|nr:hypothetical protein GX48_02780 [Paracoccidioides brasiliensis]